MKIELDEFKCVECGKIRHIDDRCEENEKCDFCNSEHCPKCKSNAVCYCFGKYECFDCDHEWSYN